MTLSAEDHFALHQLAARYWALADLVEDCPLEDLFLPDAVFDLGKVKFEGRDAIAGFLADRASGMKDSGRTTRHLSGNFLVLPDGPGRARIRSTVTVHAGSGELPLPAGEPSGIADFEDICLRQPDGGWLYSQRRARTIFVGPNAASFAR